MVGDARGAQLRAKRGLVTRPHQKRKTPGRWAGCVEPLKVSRPCTVGEPTAADHPVVKDKKPPQVAAVQEARGVDVCDCMGVPLTVYHLAGGARVVPGAKNHNGF